MRTLILIFLITLTYTVTAQETVNTGAVSQTQDTIRIKRNFCGAQYSVGDRRITYKELGNLVHDNADARHYIEAAKGFRLIAGLTGFVGGALLGYQLGNVLMNNPVDPIFLCAGAAGLGLGIGCGIAASTNTRTGAMVYNDDLLGRVALRPNPQLFIGFTGNGVGLALQF